MNTILHRLLSTGSAGYTVVLGMLTFMLWLPAREVTADITQPVSVHYRPSASAAGHSHSPIFSADGRFVAFVSRANNVVTNDDRGPHLDLFLRDTVSGGVVLISVSSNGVGGANDNIGRVALSGDGRHIAFETDANNLAPNDTNSWSDIYLRTPATEKTVLVSIDASGMRAANGPSFNPFISTDGRYVVFESLASNLVVNDFNGTNDIFVRDLVTGVTSLVSVNSNDTAAPNGPSHSPAISTNGLTVAFVSHATDLVTGVTNLLGEIYVRDMIAGTNFWAMASHVPSTWAHSLPLNTPLYYRARDPMLSPDGRYVFFKAESATVRFDLFRPTNSVVQTFTNATLSYSRFEDNPRLAPVATATPLALEADGHNGYIEVVTNAVVNVPGLVRVDWETLRTNWWSEPCQGCQANVYVTNIAPAVDWIVTNQVASGNQAWSRMEWIRSLPNPPRLAFLADPTNLIETALSPTRQIYIVDIATRQIKLVSTNRQGRAGPDLGRIVPSVRADGTGIAWETPDEDVVDADLNRAWDVVVCDFSVGNRRLISAAELPNGTGTGLPRTDKIALSANGQRVAFVSTDSSLSEDDANFREDVFVRDTVTGTNFAVSTFLVRPTIRPQFTTITDAARDPVISADGRHVAFAADSRDLNATNRVLYWSDLSTGTNRLVATTTNHRADLAAPAISPDGRLVAFSRLDSTLPPETYLFATDRPISFVRSSVSTNPIALSTSPNDRDLGNRSSINPRFSPDGNWIIFQSQASNLLAESVSPSTEYQLYARRLTCDDAECAEAQSSSNRIYRGPTRLVSYDESPVISPVALLPGGASVPVFSADSRYVAFESRPGLAFRHNLAARMTPVVVEQNGMFLTNFLRPTNLLICMNCGAPSLNADGQWAAYEWRANGATNIVVKDLASGATESVSVNLTGGGPGDGPSFAPSLSHDARFVVFTSRAGDLVPNDTNRVTDIFLRDRWNGVTHCLSRNWQGTTTGNGVSMNPVLSADGRTVAFQSWADDLVPGDYNDRRDVFVVSLAGPDTDGDGLDDELEMAYFNTLDRDGSGDFDGDGVIDAIELRSGTNPADGASFFGVLAVTTTISGSPTAGGLRTTSIVWRSTPGHRYRVQHRGSIDEPLWQSLPDDVVAQGTTASKVHSFYDTGGSTRTGFYRVQLVE